jgi:hypothetical protein
MLAKEIKQLNKAYEKSFKRLRKSFFVNKSVGLVLFAEYLKYLRDSDLLTAYENCEECSAESKLRSATITAAVAEFEAYQQNKNDQKQSKFHWNNFCEIVKLNMEDWLNTHDSI